MMKLKCPCGVVTDLPVFPALPLTEPVKCSCGTILLYGDVVGQICDGEERKFYTGCVRFGIDLADADTGEGIPWAPDPIPVPI